MGEYLSHQIKLDKTDQNGVSYREHLKQVEKNTGDRPDDLDGPPFPNNVSHIWSLFIELSGTRPVGFSGPLPITYTEIKSYCDLSGIEIRPYEVSAIKYLDNIFIKESAK